MAEIYTKDVTIASGGKLSTAADLFSGSDAEWFDPTVVAILMPAAWTDADLDFEVSHDGTTYRPLYLYGSDALLTVPAGANRAIAVDPKDFLGFRYVKVRSTQNQASARTVTLVTRDL